MAYRTVIAILPPWDVASILMLDKRDTGNKVLMQTKHGRSSQDSTWQARVTAVHLVCARLLPLGKAAFDGKEKARMEAQA